MNNDEQYPDYRAYKTPRKKHVTLYLYLILFGVILGVFLTNYYYSVRFSTEKETKSENISGTQAVPKEDEQTIPQIKTQSIQQTKNITASQTPITSVLGFEEAVVKAVQKAMPAVVSIHVSGTELVYYRFRDPFLNMLYGRRLGRQPINGMGSGVIIDPKGIIVTNDHVINITNEKEDDLKKAGIDIKVVLTDGRTFPARVIKHFPVQDFAILSVDSSNLPHIEIGSSSDVTPGQTVLAIGNPFGDKLTGGLLGGEPTVTRGIISATRRNLTIGGDGITRYYRNMLQTDASINEGNSGGALIDLQGKLVGINTAIMSPGGAGSIGIGFAYPSDRVKLILDSVKEHGDIGLWYTGLSVKELTDGIARSLGYKGAMGVLVSSVEKNSPGEECGLIRGDIIARVNGFKINNSEEVLSMFEGAIPGEIFNLSIFRDGKDMDLILKVGEKDEERS